MSAVIIRNAQIYLERERFAQSLLSVDGVIKAVGSNEEVAALAPADAAVWDARGRTVVPGFNDSHQHLLNTGIALTSVRLYDARSIADVIRIGREYIEKHHPTPGSVILGMGWNHDYFTDEKRPLTRYDLDRISTEYPIIFDRACGHILTANTRALEVAGITTETPVPEGGQIDVENGELTGVFRENARPIIRRLLAERSIERKKELIRAALAHALETGVTSIQTNDVRLFDWRSTWQAYCEVMEESPVVRLYHQHSFPNAGEYKAFLDQGLSMGQGTPFNRMGQLKLFIDGSLGARTAYMRKPYHDDPSTCGIPTMTPEEIDAMVALAVEHGESVVAHAIGDGAVERMLDAFDKVCDGANPLRHGVVHVQITDRALVERFTKNDILALVQPIFLHYDTTIVEDRVGRELAATSYAFGSMKRLGIHMSFGTDSPVEDMAPLPNIYCAVTRKTLRGEPAGGFHPEECVDIYDAVDAYTIESAYASFDEKTKGRLFPGYVADLTVIDRDIFHLPPESLLEAKVDATMVDGRFVYERAE